MNYLRHMARVLQLDESIYTELMDTKMPFRYCMINVSVLGLIYGASSVHFAEKILQNQTGPAAFNPVMILMVGLSLAFLMHGGTALFVWVFCRGMGGCPFFMPPYLNIGVAAIALWPLAPFVSGLQVGVSGIGFSVFTALTAIYGMLVIFMAVKAVSSLTKAKLAVASVAMIVYVGCFLYLWV